MKVKILSFVLAVSCGCNIWLATKYLRVSDSNESDGEHEAVLEMGLTDIVYYIKNSSLTQSQILNLSRNQPKRKGVERMQPESSKNKLYRFPVEIIFSDSGAILSVKIANELC
jgi:hypothetical protein